MKSFLLSFLFLVFVVHSAHATHNRAGEITYQYMNDPNAPYKYQVTITTYTKTYGQSIQADRPVLDSVYWGDGTFSAFNRANFVDLSGNPNNSENIRVNTYINSHSYPGTGNFDIHFEDPNRNANVVNIPNSVNVPFYLHTLLVINSNFTPDNSPVLLYPPIDQGCVGIPFFHNPSAFDADHDSLSYALTPCLGENGQQIIGFSYPAASNFLTVNSVTGDLIWDSPEAIGPIDNECDCWQYNVAMTIYSWRKKAGSYYLISTIERDMQIIIKQCQNIQPPQITAINDTCIVAGDTLALTVNANDPSGYQITLTSTGEPYHVVDPATFTPQLPNVNVTGAFEWKTKCEHIRRLPYHVQFEAHDNNSQANLVGLEGLNIFVIGPPPRNPSATPSGTSILLNWSPSLCNATGYSIYRRNGLFNGTIECPCQTGVPAYTGYTLIGTVNGANDTTFIDDNNGNGLGIGNEYCYLIVALYGDAESCASPQVCAMLKKDLPAITNVSVNFTDHVNGAMYVAWSKPSELDTIQFQPPYQYRLYHSTGFFGVNFDSNPIVIYNDLNDTTFVDSLINTVDSSWSYKVELYYTNNGILTLKGTSQKASSVYLKLSPTDNQVNLSWEEHVPWLNTSYDIFRLDTSSGSASFDSIGTTTVQSFSDQNLSNGNQYCYYIRSTGGYTSPGFVDPIINFSQHTCSVPLDNVPPCAPHLNVITDCTNEENNLSWNNPNLSCADDIVRYNIYFNSPATNDYVLVTTINDPNTTSYIHDNLSSLTGCYKITAVDSTGNESTDAEEFCVDTCRQYVLPSVFTPNGDHVNDFFHPCDETTNQELQQKNCPPYKNVKDVDMKIFNRWGNLVYQTTDKDINWNGKNKDSGKDCPEGVYYYVCKVNFYRLNGTESIELHGYIELIRGK
jgi:gliding motility-associated-like protein